MKRTLKFEEMPIIDDVKGSVHKTIKVKRPGNVVQTLVSARPSKASIIASTKETGPMMELVPIIIFEVDPDSQEEIDRKFIIIPAHMAIDSTGYLEYRGSFLYPQGVIFFMFEESELLPDFFGKDMKKAVDDTVGG